MNFQRKIAKALVVSTLLLGGCSESFDSFYAQIPARFRVSNTNTIPPLHAALNSMGCFATITQQKNNTYLIQGINSSHTIPVTAVDQQTNVWGLSGFIVGLPNIPEMGLDYSKVVCYELACPNCYEERVVTRNLSWVTEGVMKCILCGRSYDLNNQGQIMPDTLNPNSNSGKPLYRYRVSFLNNTLFINN